MTVGSDDREDARVQAPASALAVPHPACGLELSPARTRDGAAVASLANGRHFEVSGPTARLIELIDGRRNLEAIAALLSAGAEAPLDAATLRTLIERTLRPLGLVHWGDPGAAPAAERPPSPMWLRVPLVRERAVNAAAGRLVPLFGRTTAWVAGVLTLAAHAWFYFAAERPAIPRELFHVSEWLPPVLLFYLSVAAHELGHAAALRRFGQRAGEIGFGFYRLFPVFFTDVSRAWQLPRQARAVVDAGGMYVQVLSAGALITLFAATRSPLLAHTVALIDLSLLANLNPILRMDGYWLVSDLSETRNLRERSMKLLRRWTGRGVRGEARPSRFLAVYTLLSLVYFTGFALWILLRVAPHLLGQMRGAWRALRASNSSLATLEPMVFLVAGAALLAGVGWVGWNWLRTRATPGADQRSDIAPPVVPPAD